MEWRYIVVSFETRAQIQDVNSIILLDKQTRTFCLKTSSRTADEKSIMHAGPYEWNVIPIKMSPSCIQGHLGTYLKRSRLRDIKNKPGNASVVQRSEFRATDTEVSYSTPLLAGCWVAKAIEV